VGRERIRQVVYQGVQRLLQGQIELAQAAGLDICDSEDDDDSYFTEEQESDESSGSFDTSIQTSTLYCTINTGSYYDLYLGHRPESLSTVELAETEFNLVNSYPDLTFNFKFHGIATSPRIDTEGNICDYIQDENLESGEGTATWEGIYFYGPISIEMVSITRYQGETSEYTTPFEDVVFGGLAPSEKEIHVCIDPISKEHFDYIKGQPFDQLRAACLSNDYFICTPE
jgi:hypothetical protein